MDPDTTCWACRTPMDPAAAANPDGPHWDWHPTCAPTNICPCVTPWDEPKRFTIHVGARGPKTPLTGTPRDTADKWLADRGNPRDQNWEPTPTGWKTQTVHGLVTITLPKTTAGYHCVACHTNWANYATAQHHQRTWGGPCKRPTDIRDVDTGRPLLVERDNIWHEHRPNALAQ